MSNKIPSKKSNPTWRYRLCLRLVSPLLLLHLCWRGCRDGGWRYCKERLGFVQADRLERIHIHAASVGEVITVLPLIEKIQTLEQAPAFLVTTNTPTGASILEQRLRGNAIHAYLPIDFSGATKRFFRRLNSAGMWVVETEIWPWLFARAKQQNVPIAIINARLSHKSHGAIAQFFAQTYSQALVDVQILARSPEDAERYAQRGAVPSNISTIGNLKYATTEQSKVARTLLNQPYVFAASTHDDEELLLAQAWLNTSENQLLVIAPRHAERGTRLIKSLNALQYDINPSLTTIARRSLGEQPDHNARIYLADTLGEMHDWYTHAQASFVGGSLIKRGGHNVLEPARVSTPIVVGPHTYNFAEEVALLEANDAIVVVDNEDEVVQMLLLAFTDKTWAQGLGTRAMQTINAQGNVVDSYSTSLLHSVSNN